MTSIPFTNVSESNIPFGVHDVEEEQSLLYADLMVDEPASGSNEDARAKHKIRGTRMGHIRQRKHYLVPRTLKRNGFYALSVFMVFLILYNFFPNFCTDLQRRHEPLSDWSINTSLDIKEYISSLHDSAFIVPRNFCLKNTFLIIAVCTDIKNFVERQTIRETWGNTTDFNYSKFVKLHGHMMGRYLSAMPARLQLYSNYLSGENETLMATVSVVFIVGRSKYETYLGNETLTRLHNEAELYNDIIQDNFIDTYNNLTIKSVMALKHISRSCAKRCAYFLKCDDDTFVNVPNLLHFLLGGTVPLYNDTLDYYDQDSFLVMSPQNRLNATSGIMRGHQFCNVIPVSDVNSKWYMPYYMYPGEVYPQYLSGAGYLLSIDVVERLFKISLNTTLVYLEDVYITGLCAERANIKRQNHPLFNFAQSRHLCAFKGSITQHQVKEESMVEAWRYVSDYSIQCKPPGRYLYRKRLRNRVKC